MKYSFIIPFFKRSKEFWNTLLSYRHWYGARNDIEIIVIEDGANAKDEESHTALMNVLYAFGDLNWKHIISPYENQYNPVLHRNLGVQESLGSVIINTNPECYHSSDILSEFDKIAISGSKDTLIGTPKKVSVPEPEVEPEPLPDLEGDKLYESILIDITRSARGDNSDAIKKDMLNKIRAHSKYYEIIDYCNKLWPGHTEGNFPKRIINLFSSKASSARSAHIRSTPIRNTPQYTPVAAKQPSPARVSRFEKYVICACDDVKVSAAKPKTFHALEKATKRPKDASLGWLQHSMYNNRRLHWCSAISRYSYDRIGGFDDAFAAYCGYDDDDFRETIMAAEIPIVLRDDLIVRHIKHDRAHQANTKPLSDAGFDFYKQKWNKTDTVPFK